MTIRNHACQRVTSSILIRMKMLALAEAYKSQDETSDREGQLRFEILISIRGSLTLYKDVSVSRCTVKIRQLSVNLQSSTTRGTSCGSEYLLPRNIL